MKGTGKEWTVALTGDAMNDYIRERFPDYKPTVEVPVSNKVPNMEVTMPNGKTVSGVLSNSLNFSTTTNECWLLAGDEMIAVDVTTVEEAAAIAKKSNVPLYCLEETTKNGVEWIDIVDIRFMVDPKEFFTKDGVAWSLTDDEPDRSKNLQPERLKEYAKANLHHIFRCDTGAVLKRQYKESGRMDFIGLCEWAIEIGATLGPVIPDALTKDADWICDFWNKQNFLRHHGFVSKWRMEKNIPVNGGE